MNEKPAQASSTAQATQDLTGKTVGRFSVIARLGAGGMGEVYRARDTKLRRTVALKRIAPQLCADEKSRARLWKEALLVSQLSDPHIAAIHDAFEERNELFLVMELVEGQSLRERFKSPISIPEFLTIATQCAAGVAAAHRAGIQHRDIKPENILLTPSGQVKILDFGIARRVYGEDASTRDTRTGEGFTGTVSYMAPEILEQRPADERADIFSLGAVFYEALAGRNPFRAATFLETCNNILHEEPEALHKLNAQVPTELERIIRKMLAKLPDERYATAADLAVDLEALRRHPSRIGTLPAELTTKRSSRNALAWPVGIAIVAALAIGGIFAFRHFRKPVLVEHASILITDFDNQTGQKLFDQTVTEATREALEQSHYVRVMPRSQVMDTLQRMGRTGVTRVDRELGREICQRDNCRAVLAGMIAGAEPHYQITEQIVDPVHDEPVLTESDSMNSPANLYMAVDKLTKNLRNHLGESLAQIEKTSDPLQNVTTPSFEALQRYSRAMDLFAAGHVEGAIPLAQSAVALDPNFAMAHLLLARAYGALGNGKGEKEQIDAAMGGIGRVTERERYLILAENYEFQEMYEKAADELRLLTEVYPDDLEAFRGLADVSLWTGRSEEAVPAELHALELEPHSATDYLRLILDYNRLNRFDQALDAYAKAKASDAGSPLLYWGTGLAYLGKGDTKNATAAFQALGKEGGLYGQDLASLYLARVMMYEGRLREAAEELQNGLLLDQKMGSETFMPVRRYLLAEIDLTRGRAAEAGAVEQQMARDALANPESQDLRRAGAISAELGDLATARKLLASLGEMRKEHESGFIESCYFNLNGALSLKAGHPDAAIESQQRASVFFPFYAAFHGLGDALAAKQDWKDAAEAYRKYVNFQGEIFQDDSPSDWVLAHLALARSLASGGKKEEAMKSYDAFLQLWANSDADLPVVREARKERQQLGETAPSGSGSPGKSTGNE